MVYRKKTGNVDIFKTDGIWIGLMDEVQNILKDDNLELGVGDTMLIYTEVLVRRLEKNKKLTVFKIIDKIINLSYK